MSDVAIHVQFVDASTGHVFAETDMPLSLLPQSFEAATQLELSGQQWDVVTADPVTAELFARSGTLVLTLRRAQMGQRAAKDILFSLPTICDAIPPIARGTSKLHKRVLELHEDDWRQIEFLSSAYEADMHAELRAIRHIRQTAAVGPGWCALHVRQRIPTPLSVPWPAMVAAFPAAQWYDGLAYQDVAGLIEGGFGFEVAEAAVFGQHQQSLVNTLCLVNAHAGGRAEEWTRYLKPWMARESLLLVDWCRCMVCDAQGLEKFWTG